MTTVPRGTPPRNSSAQVPQQIPTRPTVPPSKPDPVTGPGVRLGVPVVGKSGK